MYVIVVYDVNVDRVNRIKKFLRRYLTWIQNSVFEGEITPADLEEVKMGIREIIDEDEDMVVIYRLPSSKSLNREIMGVDKSGSEEII
ncbi:CRISPR-associated protein, Cas2 family [Archaeoglobus sulfaticallidus PM70-1]|uniref:CRISPR-associated endoribonuclease Cas2 n=1 Tax=Archaeoglobus sulfaticallidus PM70-1 TaxID=387631 RepID=N0BE04_9EURY|nr:CRISPR-associated endonuclease Cas2 [Archaeoglobus sulfaticallidus]AGK61243.1 CRISPR-associated protein, Cas2 family [Archaeoglobus sulfaticallidus PM70-1]